MKAVMLGLALGLVMGCGKKSETETQGQANAPVKPEVPGSKQETPKSSSKTSAQKPGTVLWEFETGFLGAVRSSPAIGADGTVYVGSDDNKLYALKTNSKGPAKSPWPMRGQNARHTGRAPKKE